MTTYEPCGAFLLLQAEMPDEISKGGIHIPEQARNQINEGIIVKMGPLVSNPYHIGATVAFADHSEYRFKLDGILYLAVSIDNVILFKPSPAYKKAFVRNPCTSEIATLQNQLP